jgi:phage terminase small subunit
MPPLLNNQWEKFAQAWFSGKTLELAAIEAGYKPKWARSIGSRLSTKVNIINRYKELQDAAADAKVMSVRERKERLSEIGRARVSDFVKCEKGKSQITVGLDSVSSAAIQEVVSEDIRIGKGDAAIPAIITRLKLRDPVQAITELNRMDGSHAPDKLDINVSLVPAINTMIVQVIQVFIQVNELADPEQRKQAFALGVKETLQKQFPELPKEGEHAE